MTHKNQYLDWISVNFLWQEDNPKQIMEHNNLVSIW
jgi:hypothetical protein